MPQLLAVVRSRALVGISAPEVTIETHLSNGLPGFTLVGLPDKAVKESKDRVRSAVMNALLEFPRRRITVNLAPADLPKDSGRFDLPIALSMLVASGQIPEEALEGGEFVGELALNGDLRPVSGVLPIAMAAQQAGKVLVLPEANAQEAALVGGLKIIAVESLLAVCQHLLREQTIAFYQAPETRLHRHSQKELQEVVGQQQVKRVLEIAAAGGHSLLMSGPPGTGKTMLASRLPSILPPMTDQEALEAAAVASVSFNGFHQRDWKQRSFRAPHHSASMVALVGGSNPPKPGEISLAHHGVLFLDELPEFSRAVIEALREPIESGCITISRAARQSQFPASFQLIAAMNPCPCGFYGDPQKACRCTPDQISRYQGKLSGPFLDRIDLFATVTRVNALHLVKGDKSKQETSAQVQARVEKARAIQQARCGQINARCGQINARLQGEQLELCCQLGEKEKQLVEQVIERFNLSARAYHRALRVARTIADLRGVEQVTVKDLREAFSYRRLES